MSRFSQQMEKRERNDQKIMKESMNSLLDAALGTNTSDAQNMSAQINGAIGQILMHFGFEMDEGIPDNIDNLEDRLEYACHPYGIYRRKVKLEPGWYKNAMGSMLAIRKDNKNAVALLTNGKGYKFLDSKSGRFIKVMQETENLFEPEVYMFYRPFPVGEMHFKDFAKFGFRCLPKNYIFYLVLLSLAVTLLGLLIPSVSYYLLNVTVKSTTVTPVIAAVVFLITINISTAMFELTKKLIESKFALKMTANVSSATMMRIFSLPPSFFRDYSSGELSEMIGYINALSQSILTSIFQIGLTAVFSLLYIGQIVAFANVLVYPALGVIIANIIFSVISTSVLIKRQRKIMALQSKENGMAYGMISGIQKIKTAGAQKRAFGRWAKVYAESTKLMYKPIYARVASVAVSAIGLFVIYIIVVESSVTGAQFYAFNAAYANVSGAFASLATVGIVISQIKPTIEIVKPVFETLPEISNDKKTVTDLSGSIKLEHVTFGYEEKESPVIDNVSFEIKPGQYVAITGPTGCGKSTLLRLLLGFEVAQKGRIVYDRKDISMLDIKSLRKKIGTVLQDGKLFAGTIFDNITISAPYLSVEDAWAAAEIADIADDIKAMPMGMNTMISEGSGGISGGQKQRLMIARAIVLKPKILVFDEATSALDNISQKKISHALDRLDCTRVVVAHRLSTIKNCDRIIFFDKGKIVEDGTYDELMEKEGPFKEFVERQQL